jgi:TrmH family RNA methyltransferase
MAESRRAMPHVKRRRTAAAKPLKWYRNLATDKGRLEARAFLIEGDRAVRQVADSHPGHLLEIVTARELPAVYHRFPIRFVTEEHLRSISQMKTPQGPIAVVRWPSHLHSSQLPDTAGDRVLLLEDIQDPGNVGTLIRTASAFDYSGAILTEKCADPLSPKCVQATAGTVLSIWLRRTTRYLGLLQELKARGYSLVAADLEGDEDESIFAGRQKLVVALGNEAAGLSHRLLTEADYRFRIPVAPEKAESLNVAACGAICMYLGSRAARTSDSA